MQLIPLKLCLVSVMYWNRNYVRISFCVIQKLIIDIIIVGLSIQSLLYYSFFIFRQYPFISPSNFFQSCGIYFLNHTSLSPQSTMLPLPVTLVLDLLIGKPLAFPLIFGAPQLVRVLFKLHASSVLYIFAFNKWKIATEICLWYNL